jgi:hypothetical protein
MKTDFMENHHLVHVAPSTVIAACEDIFNGNPATDVISLKNAGGAVFFVQTNANGSGGNATIQVYSCDDATPTNTVPIAFKYRQVEAADTERPISDATSAGFATSTGANILYVIEVDARDSYLSYNYVQLKATEKTNQAVDGSIFGFLDNLRYPQNSPDSQVS